MLRVPRIPVHYRCVILYQSRLIVSMTLSARMLRLDLLSISSDSKYAGTKALCKEKFKNGAKIRQPAIGSSSRHLQQSSHTRIITVQ